MRAWDSGIDSPLVAYELAVVWSLRKDADRAMLWMQRAYDHGWRQHVVHRFDPMLANIRSDSRFQKLTERMRSEVETMRRESTEIRTLFAKTIPQLPPLRP